MVKSLNNIDYQLDLAISRLNFYEFCKFYDSKFFNEKKPHLKQIASVFQLVAEGKKKRVAISMPPRWGKSYITSLFCAWSLGRNSDKSIMRNSYSDNLAQKFSYDVRAIVKSKKYKEVFTKVELSADKQNLKGWNLTTAKQVSYFCAGVGGSITGFGCDLLAILDDPIKNWEDSQSERILDSLGNWFESTFRSRIEGDCAEIYIQTRWTNRDIIGTLIEKKLIDESEVISISALNEKGESNCPEIHSTDYYIEIQNSIDNAIFEAIFQQRPVEIKGLAFPKNELNYFSLSELDYRQASGVNAAIDTKIEGTDYYCNVIGVTCRDKTYIIDVIFNQDDYDVNELRSIELLQKNNVDNCIIEINGAGKVFANNLIDKLNHIFFKKQYNTANKITRILFQSGYIKNNFVFRNDYEKGSDYEKFMNSVWKYLKNGNVKHDDDVDTLSMLAEYIKKPKNIFA